MHLIMWGLRSSYVAGLVAALRDVGNVVVQTAGSLLEVNIAQLRHNLRTHGDAVWQQLHVSRRSALSANAYLCTHHSCSGLSTCSPA